MAILSVFCLTHSIDLLVPQFFHWELLFEKGVDVVFLQQAVPVIAKFVMAAGIQSVSSELKV
jgi:hypothetical protein